MTQHSKNGEVVEVIQSDREVSLSLHLHTRSLRPGDYRYDTTVADYRQGRRDSWETVQIVARYRQSLAREPATADVGRIIEAARKVVSDYPVAAGSIKGFGDKETGWGSIKALAEALSRAALSSGHAIAEVETDDNGEAQICTGCGTSRTVAAIKASSATAFTCCPERKMIPARLMWDAWCARQGTALSAAPSAPATEAGDEA